MSDNILSLTNLHKSYGDKVILDGVTLGLDRGVNMALIGANGTGKSTLLRIIAGQEEPDSGRVVVRSGVRVHFLEQEIEFPADVTARDVLLEPLRPLMETIEEYQEAVVSMDERAEVLLERVELLGGWDWQHRLERAAAEVGVEDLDQDVAIMSGGQRKRVQVARMIMDRAELVLLDEPTNHLDARTSEWLEAWLQATPATVILITHDRYFLDRVVDQMGELRGGALRMYAGGYTDYLGARATEEAHRESVRKRRLQLLHHELEWARRAPKARRGKSKARLDRVDDLAVEQRKLKAESVMDSFRFGAPPKLGKTILELTSVAKAFGEEPSLIDGLSMIMRKGERFGVIGPNGCGKSTLLRLCAGGLDPDAGTIKQGPNTRVAWFDQERSLLDLEATVRHNLVPGGGEFVHPGGSRIHVAGWLQRFAFPVSMHTMPVHALSGGERNRLAIARFLLEDANLLLIDEPTNDIDLLTLNVLEEALVDFQGCVLVVTHDRYFLDKVATGIIAFERDFAEGRGQVTLVQGDYTHYRRVRLEALQAERAASEREKNDARRVARAAEEAASREQKGTSGLSWKEARELERLEAEIERRDAEVGQLEGALAAPDLWAHDHARALELDRALGSAREESEALYERWEELMARAE